MEGLFKHNIKFELLRESTINYTSTNSFRNDVVLVSKIISNFRSLEVIDAEDLIIIVKPFLYYLASKYQLDKITIRFYKTNLSVSISFPDDHCSFSVINSYVLFEEVGDLQVMELVAAFHRESVEAFRRKPFKMVIELNAEYFSDFEYETDEDEFNSDDETDEEINNNDTIRLIQFFKTDKCVICLTEETKILYIKCGHLCTCSSCDNNNLIRCPSCRAKIHFKATI